MSNNIRIGKVSSVDYGRGMIKVVYPDKDGAVTDDLPYISMNDEYKMPEVGKNVLVLHLSNGSAAGVVMGSYWNQGNVPPETGNALFRKEFGRAFGEAFLRYASGEMRLCGPSILFQSGSGGISVSQLISDHERIGQLEKRVSALGG